MKRRRIKPWAKLLIIRCIMLYLIVGVVWCAIDSHRRPEHHAQCIKEQICKVSD